MRRTVGLHRCILIGPGARRAPCSELMRKGASKVKGIRREVKWLKRRYGMRVDGASVRRVQLALLDRALKPTKKG